jgi:hypothetical protein
LPQIQFHADVWDQLAFRAQIGLDRIADRYNLEGPHRRQLRRAFANFVRVPKVDLGLSKTGDGRREPHDCQFTQASVCDAEVSEIALHVEPAIGTEAACERTFGQQQRFLALHRMQMNPDRLLARIAREESGQGVKVMRTRMAEQRTANP